MLLIEHVEVLVVRVLIVALDEQRSPDSEPSEERSAVRAGLEARRVPAVVYPLIEELRAYVEPRDDVVADERRNRDRVDRPERRAEAASDEPLARPGVLRRRWR